MKGRARIAKNRSKGALALAHSGASTEQIARACEVGGNLVNYWISGARVPSAPNRRVLRKEYEINPKWWDEPSGDGADVLAKIRPSVFAAGDPDVLDAPPPVATTAKDVRDLAGQYLDQARSFMRAVENDKLSTPTERAKLLRDVAVSLDKAGRLTGASADMPVSKILKSPAWSKLGKIIADAIAGYPDKKIAGEIMRLVGEALKGAE